MSAVGPAGTQPHRRILASAGTGKTYLTKQIVEKLREKGERVMCLAKTHVACSLLGGCTLNSFIYKHLKNGSYKGWLIIDEFSLAEFDIYSLLYRLLDTCKFILTGLFATSGYSGKTSGRFFGPFQSLFPSVFGLLPDDFSEKNN